MDFEIIYYCLLFLCSYPYIRMLQNFYSTQKINNKKKYKKNSKDSPQINKIKVVKLKNNKLKNNKLENNKLENNKLDKYHDIPIKESNKLQPKHGKIGCYHKINNDIYTFNTLQKINIVNFRKKKHKLNIKI